MIGALAFHRRGLYFIVGAAWVEFLNDEGRELRTVN